MDLHFYLASESSTHQIHEKSQT